MRLRRVLDQEQVVAARDLEQRGHVRRAAVHVDRHEGARLRRDRRLGGAGIEAPRLHVDVREHRDGAHLHHGERGRHEAVRGDDDLVARAYARRGERHDQRARPAVREQAVLRADVPGELLLERHGLRREGHPREDAPVEHA